LFRQRKEIRARQWRPWKAGATATKAQLTIAAARAWALAEAKERVLKPGQKLSDFQKTHPDVEPILEPGKHFALMFGISQDYAYMTRAVL